MSSLATTEHHQPECVKLNMSTLSLWIRRDAAPVHAMTATSCARKVNVWSVVNSLNHSECDLRTRMLKLGFTQQVLNISAVQIVGSLFSS